MDAATVLASPISAHPRLQIKLFRGRYFQIRGRSLHYQTSCKYSLKLNMERFDELSKARMQIDIVKERLWGTVPEATRAFPWKKATDILLQRLLFLVKKASKWSFFTIIVFSAISDVVLSVVSNKELIIPFGLFFGCMMADYLNEASQELSGNSKENGLTPYLIGITGFCILIKIISSYFGLEASILLLHVANGGLMQALWLWRKSLGKQANTIASPTDQDASTAVSEC